MRLEGTYNLITNSSFKYTGCENIQFGGYITNDLIYNNNDFSYNNLTYASLFTRISANLVTVGIGNRYTHNEISFGPHSGIRGFYCCGHNNNTISYNHVHDFCYEGTDIGAIYYGRCWTCGGNIYANNLIENVYRKISGTPNNCLYLDDMLTGQTILNNTFRNCFQGVLVGGGKNNILIGNTFLGEFTWAVSLDDRGNYYQADNPTSAVCVPHGYFQQQLESFNYTRPPFSLWYSYTNHFYDDNKTYCAPTNNVYKNNNYCGNTFGHLVTLQPQWNNTFKNNVDICPPTNQPTIKPTASTSIPVIFPTVIPFPIPTIIPTKNDSNINSSKKSFAIWYFPSFQILIIVVAVGGFLLTLGIVLIIYNTSSVCNSNSTIRKDMMNSGRFGYGEIYEDIHVNNNNHDNNSNNNNYNNKYDKNNHINNHSNYKTDEDLF
jgi:hypothetical protein